MTRTLTIPLILALASTLALAQTKPAFGIADIHNTPRADWVKSKAMDGGFLGGDRYSIRRATMLDLIKTAYNVDADKVFGGPPWLDYDRFDIAAKTKPGTSPANLRLMLQALLADRFHLTLKTDTQPVTGYVLTKSKEEVRFKPSKDNATYNGCPRANRMDQGVMTASFQCHGITMDEFASFLRGPLTLPVLNSTSLAGTWDIDFQFTQNARAGITQQAAMTEAVTGLGLKLDQGKVPQPVLNIESVDEKPTPNSPNVTQALPPLPAPQFEVASMRVCNPDDSGGSRSAQFEPGGRVTANCMPPTGLMSQAWGLAPFQYPEGLPKGFTGRTLEFNVSISAKAPEGTAPDRDTLNAMVRNLMIDRYKMKLHYEDRPVDAETLVADKPKLTKANPANRTGCTRQNQQRTGSVGPTHLVCQNMTMEQFAEQLRTYDSQIFYPVLDKTGLEGAWDFTIDYDPVAGLALRAFGAVNVGPLAGAAGQPTTPEVAAPRRVYGFADAIQKQLGLKLETTKRPEPVLVIDHMEEKPSEQ